MYRKMSLPLLALLLSGCASINHFALPEGDPEDGRQAFISLGCVACHSAHDAEHRPDMGTGIHFSLGSMTRDVSYVELVTSIINPSHRIAFPEGADTIDKKQVSKMPVFNDVMTVRQLADIVRYLSPQYEMLVVPDVEYPYFDYGQYPY